MIELDSAHPLIRVAARRIARRLGMEERRGAPGAASSCSARQQRGRNLSVGRR